MNCIDLMSKRSKQRKTTKLIKLQWIASIWCQNGQKSQNYKRNQITINLHRFYVKTIKNVELLANLSKQRKTTKVIKLQWIASIWCQKHQTNAKLQKWSYFDEFASIWRQNDQNNAKLQKWSYFDEFASIWRQNDQNNAKLQNWSNYNELHRFDVKTVKNRKTTKGIKLRSFCIDLTSKRSKMLSNVAKHSKQRKTTKLVKLQWIASIWCQNGQKPQNYKRNQIRINLHRFEVKTIKNVELRRKSFKTTQNYESHQITMNCIDLMSKTSNQRKTTKVILFRWICIDLTSKRSKMLSYVAKHSKQRKTTKLVKLQIIMHYIDLTSKRSKKLSYVPKLQKWSNYNELHWFDVKTFKTFELGRKTTKVIKLQWIASIWCQKHQTNPKLQKWSYFDEFASIWRQNDQNNAKLRKWSNYNALHRFDVKTI